MSKRVLMFVFASLVACGSAYARGGGGGGGMGGGMGGMSGGHMSSQGMANTNGPEAADRDRGRERAEDRRSATAASHEKAAAQQKSKRRNKGGQAGSAQ